MCAHCQIDLSQAVATIHVVTRQVLKLQLITVKNKTQAEVCIPLHKLAQTY